MKKNNNIVPFVKWVGGKRKVIENHLRFYIPKDYKKYIEPFIGGGAMFCFLKPKESIINDINFELINAYKVIKNNYQNLCLKLDEFKINNSEEFFYKIRKQCFSNEIDIAARFIYLNKTCFNGLYRVNKNNEFNVPFNKKNDVNLYDKQNIINWHNYLNENKIDILNIDYLKCLELSNENDFVYCDPPYDFEKDSKCFVSYSKNGFDEKDQINLSIKLKELDKRNVKWMLSNHNTKLINELYKDFKIINIKTNRMINSNSENRINTGDEVIIVNYDIQEQLINCDKEIKYQEYIKTLEKTNMSVKQLIDYEKIKNNIRKIEIDLNLLNHILCRDKVELSNRISELYKVNPNCFQTLLILSAIRNKNDDKYIIFKNENVKINNLLNSEKNIVDFLKESKLEKLILEGNIKNFVDYAFGIEVGLDTNARKNRVGTEEKNIFKKIKLIFKEFDFIDVLDQYEIFKQNKELSELLKINKKFDVVVINKKTNKFFLIENSYYNSSGSKINETNKSYNNIFKTINELKNNKYKFLWIADGPGMKSIKNQLKENINQNYIFNKKQFFDEIRNIVLDFKKNN